MTDAGAGRLAAGAAGAVERPVRVVVPFVSTHFPRSLQAYLVLWPLWWLIGIDQLLPPAFLLWELGRHLHRRHGRIAVSGPVVWALLLALWWVVPAPWVDAERRLDFAKDTATMWSQIVFLLLVVDAVRREEDWWRVARGLDAIAAYIAIGGVLFGVGIFRGSIPSVVGVLLRSGPCQTSAFFASICDRTLGGLSPEAEFVGAARAFSLTLQYTGLGLVCLLLMPYVTWRAYGTRGRERARHVLVYLGLLVSLVSAQSRVAWAAYAAGVFVGAVAVVYAVAPRRGRPFVAAGLAVSGALMAVLAFDAWAEITGEVQAALFDVRPGSSMTRLRIYEATFQMYPEHPIAGWGTQARIPGLESIYNAGTHSSILAMLFRHGAVGLVLYLGLWVSIWRKVVAGARAVRPFPKLPYFWTMMTVALLTFNLREVIDEWWWDQVVCMTLWTMWGLALSAQRIAARHAHEAPLEAPA